MWRVVIPTALVTVAAMSFAFYMALEAVLLPVSYSASCPRIDRTEAKRQAQECLEKAACIWTRF